MQFSDFKFEIGDIVDHATSGFRKDIECYVGVVTCRSLHQDAFGISRSYWVSTIGGTAEFDEVELKAAKEVSNADKS